MDPDLLLADLTAGKTAALAASMSSMRSALLASTWSWNALFQIAFTSGGRGDLGALWVGFPWATWKSWTRHATASSSMRSTPELWSWSMWLT